MAQIAPRHAEAHTDEIQPTLAAHALFTAKVMAHRVLRHARDARHGPRKLAKTREAERGFPFVAGESKSALWSEAHLSERRFEFGKVHNLRRALAALDGTVIREGKEFSFWKQVGKATRRRGYVTGRMLQQGCLVPAVGGGLCQLSNALYDVALQAGCNITERHAHTRIVAGSAAAMGRDATIAWNYVDFRFRVPADMVLDAKLSAETMTLRLRTRERITKGEAPTLMSDAARHSAESCGTCDKDDCFRYEVHRPAAVGRTAFLVDECWPEFRDHVARAHGANDVLGIPIDGARFHAPRYAWDTRGFTRVGAATMATLIRSFTSRRLKEQGAERREAELQSAARLARSYARLLAPDVIEVVVAQSLLPFLWRMGELGGRRFSVLATRPPMHLLQDRLDVAAHANPLRATLADFRADPAIVEAEREAFAAAERIVTPHAELAMLFRERAEHLDWTLPRIAPVVRSPIANRIAFPGPTVARKGAYQLREAARALDLEVLLLGSELEGDGFWSGVGTLRRAPGDGPHAWLASVVAVVQPALFEERPRQLLAALAAGVPVIATAGCGLAPRPGLTILRRDDPASIVAALGGVLSAQRAEPELACAS